METDFEIFEKGMSRLLPGMDFGYADAMSLLMSIGTCLTVELSRIAVSEHLALGDMHTLNSIGVGYGPRIRQADLARLLGVTTAAMSGRIDRLVAKGFVRRHSLDDDHRGFSLELTARGLSVCTSLLRKIADTSIFAIAVRSLTGDERTQFIESLRRIANAMLQPENKAMPQDSAALQG